MPYKANEARRHKIPRARYKVTNWPEYDRALQQRGSLTVWVTPEALAAWHPPKTGRRGRSRHYSDIAIETGHLLRLAFGRPWRQTEGLLRSLASLLGVDVGVPDHTTFSRRSPGLMLAGSLARAQRTGPVHVVIDATGLKVYGAGEWLAEAHGGRGRRTWRKLHLAVDPDSGEILASELTSSEEGDASLVGPLLEQIAGPIASVTADGAYDGEPVYRAVAERQPDPPAAVIIPPRAGAVASPTADTAPSQRDRHIRMIKDRGRMGWQKAVGYGRRSLGETAVFRYKAIIGRGLRARTLPTQKTETRVACAVLNRMTGLGMPISQRAA
jgi:Transposase DDE domain